MQRIENKETDMALAELIAGAYSSTWTPAGGSPAAVGITRDGWQPTIAILQEEVRQSDTFGRSLIETFYQGAKAGLSCTFLEWNAQCLGMIFPFGSLLATGSGKFIIANASNPIGRRGSDVAGSLILTVTANTPAAAKPATVTYGKLLPTNDRDYSWTYNSSHRIMSANFEALLYLSTSDYIMYSYT